MAVGLSGCKIVSATPDTEKVIEVRPGQTIEFKVSGPLNTPTSKAVWEVAKMNTDDEYPQYDTVLERSGTFKLTVDPDGEGTNRIRVRCVIYTLGIGPGGPGTGCPFIFGCLSWYPSDSSRSWDIRIIQDTAPVWQGNYHIRDSRDIELLKDYTTVSGSLFINGDDVINLEGIENLSSIGGSLCIIYNDALTSLSGLQNITSVPRSLSIDNNNALTSLSGLENLTSVGSLSIWGNHALTSLSVFQNITSVTGNLYICYNDALTSLSGLENITSVGYSLYIKDNEALTALGMTGLQRVGDDFSILSNSSLCSSLAEELMNQVLAGGGIGGKRNIEDNKDCTTP